MKKELKNERKLTYVLLALMALILVAGAFFLKRDFSRILLWWLTILAMGTAMMPLTYLMFHRFSDLGWAFSKPLGIAASAWLMWLLSSLKWLKFHGINCIIVCLIIFFLNILLYLFVIKKKKICIGLPTVNNMLFLELLFLGMFLFWCYLKAFKPQAYGTEKFMDFAFMKIMERSDYMPPTDMWLSGVSLNYYYVGQFVATFLCKLSGISVDYGYNLMLMMVPALSFTMVYSLVKNCFSVLFLKKVKNKRLVSSIAGIISATAVVFAGNVHYIIYGIIKPAVQKFMGLEPDTYWFPNSTRYIGYNPDVPDKTIHEFPSYSFVLGDLHAHVLNIIFVIAILGILFSWLLYRKELIEKHKNYSLLKEAFAPQILVIGFLIGFFHTTNFWDFPIYYVVAGAIILFSNLVVCRSGKDTFIMTSLQGMLVLEIGSIVCLPFTISFKQISTQIAFVDRNTRLYQLAVLWALPVTIVLLLIGNMINNHIHSIAQESAELPTKKRHSIKAFFEHISPSDLFMFVLGLCSIGLILMPEVVYVKDIYDKAYSRSNTMFKLTYQAYIMFGIVIGYALVKLFLTGKKVMRVVNTILFLIWLGTVGYFGNASHAWFGDYWNQKNYQSLDATAFLETENYADYEATNWLNENVTGTPVVLEANGDSYTFYERISTFTGLPTILGWRTHEWLWQSEGLVLFPPIVTERTKDVQTIYTSQDEEEVRKLLDEYDVSYIYIGKCEYEKFPELNEEFLKSLGTVVFETTTDMTLNINGADQTVSKTTYIISVSQK